MVFPSKGFHSNFIRAEPFQVFNLVALVKVYITNQVIFGIWNDFLDVISY